MRVAAPEVDPDDADVDDDDECQPVRAQRAACAAQEDRLLLAPACRVGGIDSGSICQVLLIIITGPFAA